MADRPREPLTQKNKRAFKKARRVITPNVTDRTIVSEVLPEIRRKLEVGWSYDEVRAELARTLGFRGTRRTLYNYMWELTRSTTKRARPATPSSADGEHLVTKTPEIPPPPPRRSVRETLCGLKHPPEASEQSEKKTKRRSLVEILNRPV